MARIIPLLTGLTLAVSPLIAKAAQPESKFDWWYPSNQAGYVCEQLRKDGDARARAEEERLKLSLRAAISKLPVEPLESMRSLQERLKDSQARLTESLSQLETAQKDHVALKAAQNENRRAYEADLALIMEARQLDDTFRENATFKAVQDQFAIQGMTLDIAEFQDRHLELILTENEKGLAVRTLNGNPENLAAAPRNDERVVLSLSTDCVLYHMMKAASSR